MTEQYINKAAVVAEIKSIIDGLRKSFDPNPLGNMQECLVAAEIEALELALTSINSLDVKKVDLETEARMKECPFRQVCCTMYEGHVLECRGACSWAVDYPKLKELKSKHKEEQR